jgi:hypothetical protein
MVALLHLAVAGRYDIFRNELYCIVCGRHPDFGYVDQPPLIRQSPNFVQRDNSLLKVFSSLVLECVAPHLIKAWATNIGRSQCRYVGIVR